MSYQELVKTRELVEAKQKAIDAEIEAIRAPYLSKVRELEVECDNLIKKKVEKSRALSQEIYELGAQAETARELALTEEWRDKVPATPQEFGLWLKYGNHLFRSVSEVYGYKEFESLRDAHDKANRFDEREITRLPKIPGVTLFGVHNPSHKFYVAVKDGVIIGYLSVRLPRDPGDQAEGYAIIGNKPLQSKSEWGSDLVGFVYKKPLTTWVEALNKFLEH